MKHVVTLTLNPAVDVNTAVDSVAPEKKLRCDAPRLEPGGGGINVSRAILRLGGTSRALYLAGGPYGELLERLLAEEGIDQHPLPIEGLTRESFIVYEHSSGQQYRFGLPGPEVDADAWQRCLDALASTTPRPAYVVASGSLPPGLPDDAFATIGEVARSLGARFVLDTSGSPLRHGIDGGVYLIKPNIGEFRALVGEDLPHEEDQARAARALVDDGRAEVVIISLGAAGAWLVHEGGARHLHAPTVSIRSKVGAGDSMVAGIVTGLARGLDLVDAARMGIAAGAAAVMTDGTELCRREDVVRLHEELRRAR
jgi:6-phosphofructokinase 2